MEQTAVELRKENGLALRLKRSVRGGLAFCKKNPGFTIGLIVMVLVLLVALFAESLCPYDPAAGSPKDKLLPPFWMEGADPRFLLPFTAL